MQFLVIGHDGTDEGALARRLAARPAHVASGDEMKAAGTLLFAVATLNESKKMVGSVLTVEFPNRQAVEAWLKTEPYVTGKVWEKIDVIPCKVGPAFTR